MNNEVDIVRQRLQDGDYTCVVFANGEEYCSRDRGVKPLLSLLQSGGSVRGGVAADKTVGAGAAHLYVLLGIRALWANVISDLATQVLKKGGIEFFCGKCVPYIINRQGDGVCPIEKAVSNAKTSREAYDLIVETLDQLQKRQNAEGAGKKFKANAE